MATARETIETGLQALKVLGFGQSASSAQAEYCLRQLSAYIGQLAGFGGSLPLVNVRVTASYQVETRWPAVRLMCIGGQTITLPEFAVEGQRVELVDASGTAASSNIVVARNGWRIDGLAANYTISTNGATVMLMFRADTGNWVLIEALGLDDTLPFPSDFDNAIALNAARYYTLFGQHLSPEDEGHADRGATRLRARYAKPPAAQFDPAVSGISGERYGVSISLSDFENGIDT